MALHPPRRRSSGMSALLQAEAVSRQFSIRSGMFRPRSTLHAVNGVDLAVERGAVLGIVGESGCGKSTLARMLLGLTPPSAGAIKLEGQDIRQMDRRALARRVQPIFQDPYSSLNPRRSIASIVSLPLEVHGIPNPKLHAGAVVGRAAPAGGDCAGAGHEPRDRHLRRADVRAGCVGAGADHESADGPAP
jgi:ABC-type glutathione transport system ATPase component